MVGLGNLVLGNLSLGDWLVEGELSRLGRGQREIDAASNGPPVGQIFQMFQLTVGLKGLVFGSRIWRCRDA